MTKTLVEARGLKKYYPVRGEGMRRGGARQVRAVDDVSLSIDSETTLALVGESGCGKSTMGRLLLRLIEPTSGDVLFDGRSLLEMSPRELRKTRRQFQIVFQDPYSSLNPRHSVGEIIAWPMRLHRLANETRIRSRVRELLQLVGLQANHAERHPHQFSGGQRQRIGIARALALESRFIVLDEPTSSLDVSVQAQILNLLQELKERLGLTYLLISHNLGVVEYMADQVAVMYLGQIVEFGPVETIMSDPRHPYTHALLSAVLSPVAGEQRERIVLRGDPPDPANPPGGCRFHPRCPYAEEISRQVPPTLREIDTGHLVACHLAEKIPSYVQGGRGEQG